MDQQTQLDAPRGATSARGSQVPGWLEPLAARVYYGWIVLGAVSVTELISWGILYYAFAVFVAPMGAELRWSPAALTGGFSVALLCAGLAAVPVGRWLDRHGPRALMTTGSILGSLLLVAWSQIAQLWAFYAIMAAIGVVSAMVLYEPAFAIVAVWFRRERGRALTMLTFFGAWASFVFIPLSAWLATAIGWRQALLVLAAILAGLTIPLHALVLRRRPQDIGLVPDGAAATPDPAAEPLDEHSVAPRIALRDAGYWRLASAFAASTIASVALTVHLIPYLIAHGHSSAFAATIAGLFGLMSLVGRLLIGPLGDRYPRRRITMALMGMQVLGVLVLTLAPTTIGALVYIALFGAGSGTLTIMRAALLAERYGPAHYGSISGSIHLILTGAKVVAPVGVGLLAALPDGYSVALWALLGLLGAGMLALRKL